MCIALALIPMFSFSVNTTGRPFINDPRLEAMEDEFAVIAKELLCSCSLFPFFFYHQN